ncbi:silencing defective [Parasponia andersonii]|uniref:Silencing defective n=1 Tax=Parasponia andersonii TaxID=3476 RepID=A0A2P5AJQ4_PARAD|nr:silencing defective [Parasponia andersonii]
MEASGFSGSGFDDEERGLKGLLDAFGSAFTLDEIASAYCKADRNPDLAYEFLYQEQGSTSASTEAAANGEARRSEQAPESLSVNLSDQSFEGNGNSRPWNPKNGPVSVGSVSSIIGKAYIRTARSTNASGKSNKPMKLDSKVLPVSELWGEEAKSNSERNDGMHNEMEEFLFRMLGDGFKLERDVIRQVLEACGYDMPKSMGKLFDLSAATLDNKNRSVSGSTDELMGLRSKAEVPSHQMKCTNNSGGTEDTSSNSSKELSTGQKQRNHLERDILTSLFSVPEKKNDYVLPKQKAMAVKSSGIFGEAVAEPPCDFVVEQKTAAVYPQTHDECDKDEDSYLALRNGVKEYYRLMKDYYQAAVTAFVKGNHVLAGRLLEEGRLYHKRAREADEESNIMILKTKDVEEQDELLLDLHDHGSKDAIQILKCHLSSLAGIPSFRCLKVIIETNEEDSSNRSRRRLVLKLLEKESIKWVEGENAGTILIRLDGIDRKRLSFVKK